MQSQTCSFLNECIHNSSLPIVSCPVKSCSTLHDQTVFDGKASSVTIHLISWSPSIQPLLKTSYISPLYSLYKVIYKHFKTVSIMQTTIKMGMHILQWCLPEGQDHLFWAAGGLCLTTQVFHLSLHSAGEVECSYCHFYIMYTVTQGPCLLTMYTIVIMEIEYRSNFPKIKSIQLHNKILFTLLLFLAL